ncbi:hypothetical protein [Halarcobacter anaerophilus]|uniref:Uncharacterized protein n=1 Tax=Halarcobacter anaerophilus TaxID=877500 RepID=A0A4Q0XXC6_9BACT|nr:hypothetical protein [Halarcobacter anaerophilus]QDF30279.1 hypothetical protein AANAER_2837 [Halarcobacter anaerophilus]RXJ62162.1 hypothetical protein CRV06_10370 [Halarcobacter anaerophilus]
MEYLISLLEKENLQFNICYKEYKIEKNKILIKKSKAMYSSFIETRELLKLYNIFGHLKNVEFLLLENEDISIKLKEEDH